MCVLAVELSGEALQAAAQPVLVSLNQLLTLRRQLHTDTKLTFPVDGKQGSASSVRATFKRNNAGAKCQPDVLNDGSVGI